jgi:uncharacterized phage protein (TIGR02218 family)
MAHAVRNKTGGHVDADFWTQYASQTPRMALCVKITSSATWGSEIVGFTTNSRNMTLTAHAGVTFKATAALSPTAVTQTLDVASVMELTGAYETGEFEEADLLAGKWDQAEVEVFSVCWDDETLGEVLWHKGNLGEAKTFDNGFSAETRSAISKLSNIVNPVTTTNCRNLRDGGFRGTACGHVASTVDISAVTYNIEATVTVATVTDEYHLIVTHPVGAAYETPVGFFAPNGKMTVNTAANHSGTLQREIETSSVAAAGVYTLTLRRKFPFTVEVGDTFDIVAGCSGSVEDCIKYTNIERRQAEDYIPNIESANRIPDGR